MNNLDKSLFSLTNRVKLAWVNSLRYAFKSSLTPDIYKYSDKLEEAQIAIYREFPLRVKKYPCIVVKVSPTRAGIVMLDEETISEVYENNVVKSIRYFLPMGIPVELTVYAQTTTDRERITDLLYFFVRALFRNRFAQEDMSYKNIRLGGEKTEIEGTGKQIYVNSVEVDLYLEIEREIDMTIFEEIKKIDLFVNTEGQVTEHLVE